MIDISLMRDESLKSIAEKVLKNERVSDDDALTMLRSNDVLALGAMANHIREELHGDRTWYGVNMNLNYTNICELRCPLCAFSKDAGDPDAYLYTLERVEKEVREASEFGIDEVHIVGGLHRDLKLDYFEELLRTIKRINPDIFIVAFTATEYDFFAKLNRLTVEEVMDRLIAAGLGALPGGGAEIFAQDKRDIIAPQKISGARWLEVMRIAHGKGLRTNATMLYNQLESDEDIVAHMGDLRKLQDETGGFKTFVPLPFHEENTSIKAKRHVPTGFDDMRIYATARVYLRTIPHLKGLWMYLGEKMAQTLLRFGVDDIGATYHYEKVVHSAGARTADYGSEDHLRRLITTAGRQPVRSTANYIERAS